jgi:hypothetical protein
MARRMELNYNTVIQYRRNVFESITHFFTLFGVLHNPTKTFQNIIY